MNDNAHALQDACAGLRKFSSMPMIINLANLGTTTETR